MFSTSHHATCDVYSPKAVEHKCTENFTNIILLLFIKYISFGFIELLDSKQKFNTGIMSAMECAEVAAFTFTVRQIRWCLLWKFDSPKATVINLFEFCEYFVVGLGN